MAMEKEMPLRYVTAIVTVFVLASMCGCRQDATVGMFSESLWNPFGLDPLFGIEQEPIRIGVVCDDRSVWDVRSWWDLRDKTPWSELRAALAWDAGRPVQVVQLKPFQVAAQLKSGRLEFAMLSDAQLDDMSKDRDACVIIARADAVNRTGLVVASAKSDIASITDIAGKRFAFGPRGDLELHYGAAKVLNDGGVSLEQIQREILPVAALQYHLNSLEVAKEVAYGLTSVGVIARADYDRYPETGGQFFPLSFSKDQFRILGETLPINFGPFVASVETEPELVSKVRSFLTAAAVKSPRVTESLGIAAFNGVNVLPETGL